MCGIARDRLPIKEPITVRLAERPASIGLGQDAKTTTRGETPCFVSGLFHSIGQVVVRVEDELGEQFVTT